MKRCTNEIFYAIDWNQLNKIGFGAFYCLKNVDKVLLNGRYLTQNYSYVSFEVDRCTNKTDSLITCKSDEEIDYFFKKGPIVQLLIRRKIFEASSFTAPLKEYIDGTIYDYLDSEEDKILDIYLSETKIISANDPLQIEKDQKLSYPEIKETKSMHKK